MHACSSFTCKVRQLQYRCAPPRGQPEVPGDISLHPGSTFSSAAHFPAPANQELPQVHTPSHGTKIFCSSEEGFPDTSQDDRDQWFEKWDHHPSNHHLVALNWTLLPATMLTNLRAENPEMSSADHVAGKHATIGPEVRGACLPVLLD